MCCLKALVAVVILIICGFINWWHNTHTDYGQLQENYFNWSVCMEKFTDDLDDEQYWQEIENVVRDCEGKLQIDSSRLKVFSNADWKRFHLMARKQERNQDVFIISAGVGHNISAEQKLKPMLTKESLFIVFDPDISGGEDYGELGLYCPRMVGNRSGHVDMTYRVLNGSFIKETVRMVTMAEVKTLYVPRDTAIIDNLWIDFEYSEYDVLDQVSDIKEQPALCHFNIKIHAPRNIDQKTQFRGFLTRIINDRRYAFVKMSLQKNTCRIFFVNFKDSSCTSRYLLPE